MEIQVFFGYPTGNFPVKCLDPGPGEKSSSATSSASQHCCDKTDMNKPFLIKNIKQRKLKQIRNNPITTHITPKWTSTSIGPGNQSEEACPSVTIDRHQVEGDTTEKNHRDTLTSTHRPKIPRNKLQNAVTAGITTNRHTTHLEASNCIYPIQGGFTLPCIPFSSLSSPRLVDRGFCIYRRYRYKNPLAKDNPHFFSLHHSRIEPTPSQTHRHYFLIRKNPELPSYKQNSISRYHHTYTKN